MRLANVRRVHDSNHQCGNEEAGPFLSHSEVRPDAAIQGGKQMRVSGAKRAHVLGPSNPTPVTTQKNPEPSPMGTGMRMLDTAFLQSWD